MKIKTFAFFISIIINIICISYIALNNIKEHNQNYNQEINYTQDSLVLSLIYPFIENEYDNDGNWLFLDNKYDGGKIEFSNFKACHNHLIRKQGIIKQNTLHDYECLNTDNGRYFNIQERIKDFKESSKERKMVYNDLSDQLSIINDNYKGEYDEVKNWVFNTERVTSVQPFYNAISNTEHVKTFKECLKLVSNSVLSINYSANIKEYEKISISCKNGENIKNISYVRN